MSDEKRPAVLSEVRAWMLVAITLLVHTVGVTWWGATISAEVRSLKENTIFTNAGYKELEQRTRVLEQRQAILEANAK